MKNFITFFLVLLIASCCNDKQKDELGFTKLTSKEYHRLIKYSYHGISFNTFKFLTTQFRTSFKNESENVAFGGFLPIQSIQKPAAPVPGDTSGIQYFLCCKVDAQDNPIQLYIAYRTILRFLRNSPNFDIDNNFNYYKSITPYYYEDQIPPPGTDWTEEQKDSVFFCTYHDTRTDANPTVIGTTVRADNQTFIRLYNRYLMENSAHGFFLDDELDALRNITDFTVRGIRFTFGYDYSADANKIKILFFAVDDNGLNRFIKTEPDVGHPNTPVTHYPMIERAWPPSAD